MFHQPLFVLMIVASYLIGALNSSIIISKLMGLPSPKTYGSGNPGTTNMLRTGNKKAALYTLVGDILKGVITVTVARLFISSTPFLATIMLATVIGHIFPVYYRFQGGKGVATVLGTALALSPLFGLMVLATWLLIAVALRYSSLAAIIAALLMPLYGACLFPLAALFPISITTVIILFRHKNNVYRLLKGDETKIKFKKN